MKIGVAQLSIKIRGSILQNLGDSTEFSFAKIRMSTPVIFWLQIQQQPESSTFIFMTKSTAATCEGCFKTEDWSYEATKGQSNSLQFYDKFICISIITISNSYDLAYLSLSSH